MLQFMVLAEKQWATAPLMITHCMMGVSLMFTRRAANKSLQLGNVSWIKTVEKIDPFKIRIQHATSPAPFTSYFSLPRNEAARKESEARDSVFGMHNRPDLPIGKFAIRPGPMMAGGAFFDITITITGKGSHGARPEEGIDPVLSACHVTTALQAIVFRNISPADTAVLSVTTIQAGHAYNVISQTAVIRSTFRTFSNNTMNQIENGMRRIASGVAAASGATT
jgi:hypothetical protein